ncbi:MAG: hypothetical protein Roseis2KO_47860 [Roseivirga sp.]
MKHNIFKIKEPPFLLTVLIGIMLFQFNEMLNIQKKTPLLTYSITKSRVDNSDYSDIICKLHNLSHTEAFRNMELSFSYLKTVDEQYLWEPKIKPIHPSMLLPDPRGFSEPDNHLVVFSFPIIQPGGEYHVSMKTDNLNPDEYPYIYIDTPSTVRLVEYNWITYIIEHQILMNAFLFAISLVMIFLYFFLAKNKLKLDNE